MPDVGTSLEGNVLTVGIEGSGDICVHVRVNGWFPGTTVSSGNHGHHIQFNSIITWTVCRVGCCVLPSLWTCRDRGTFRSYTCNSALEQAKASNVACHQVQCQCQNICSNSGIKQKCQIWKLLNGLLSHMNLPLQVSQALMTQHYFHTCCITMQKCPLVIVLIQSCISTCKYFWSWWQVPTVAADFGWGGKVTMIIGQSLGYKQALHLLHLLWM